MEDDEIVIGIKNDNTNSKRKKNSGSKNDSNLKNKQEAQNSSQKKKEKKIIKNKKSNNSGNKQNLKNKSNAVEKNNNSGKRKNSKKLGSKSRISLALNFSKNNVETKSFRIKLITIILIILVFIIFLLSSSLFNVKTIIVNNNSILSDEKIISLSSIEKFNNIFKFNKISAINNIKSNSYIEDVKIKRKLPGTIEINVKERIPTFMLQFADSYVYINNQGYILEISNDKLNIPIVLGCSTDLVNMKPGNRINDEDLKKFNTVIKIYEIAKSKDLSDLITKIDVSDTKNYTIILEGEGKTVYLGDCNDSDLNTKMLYLKSIVDASSGRAGEVFLNVNLNSQKVYIRWSTE